MREAGVCAEVSTRLPLQNMRTSNVERVRRCVDSNRGVAVDRYSIVQPGSFVRAGVAWRCGQIAVPGPLALGGRSRSSLRTTVSNERAHPRTHLPSSLEPNALMVASRDIRYSILTE